MAKQLYANNATGYLNSTINNTQTSIVLQSGNGSLFPTPTGGDYFYVTIYDGISTIEIVKVTARTADTFTVERGQDDTVAASFPTGSVFELRAVKANYNTFVQSIGDQTIAGIKTFSNNPVLNSGAANSVLYLNGSKVATSDSALTFDGTNFSVGSNKRLLVGRTSSDANNWGIQNLGTSAYGSGIQLTYAGVGSASIWVPGANSLAFGADNASGASEQMRLTSTGLGLGTSSPGYKLDVLGNARIQQSNYVDAVLRISQSAVTSGNVSQILFQDQLTNTTAFITAYGSAWGSGNNYALAFGTNGAERARIDSSGNLLIGTTTNTSGSKVVSNGTIESTTGGFKCPDGTTLTSVGTAATLNVGTSANNVVQLDGSAKLPAVDGSQLTNLPIPTTLGAIGSYILGRPADTNAYNVNDTISGSSLYRTSNLAFYSSSGWGWWRGSTPVYNSSFATNVGSGSWRCVTQCASDSGYGLAGLWVRYA